MIPYGRQLIDNDDIAAVTRVLKSVFLTQGPVVQDFENAVAKLVNADFAVATNSATSALHIACLSLGVGPGDLVWTSPNSFVASANCALYCGAQVDFVDIDINTGSMSTAALNEKLVDARNNNCLPKVVIPVHFAGHSCEMLEISKLAEEFNFRVIEDASHCIGGTYMGKPVGSCQYSDITVFSFHPVKIITCAEGGMALTNQPELAQQLTMLRSHGITSVPSKLSEPSHGPWYYEQQMLGFNYRLSDIHAALGLSQLDKLAQFVNKRNMIAKRYDDIFAHVDEVSPLQVQPNAYSSYHLYVIRLPHITKALHKRCVEFLREEGIIGHLHYIPIYLQPYYKALGFPSSYCKAADTYYGQAITLPLYPDLTEQEQDLVVEKLLTFLGNARNSTVTEQQATLNT